MTRHSEHPEGMQFEQPGVEHRDTSGNQSKNHPPWGGTILVSNSLSEPSSSPFAAGLLFSLSAEYQTPTDWQMSPTSSSNQPVRARLYEEPDLAEGFVSRH